MRRDDLRIMAKVADLYYRRSMKQAQISKQLGLHQSSVSRLLKKAAQEGIVQISLNYPTGFFAELEGQVEDEYGLQQVILVDSLPRSETQLDALGSAAASYLTSVLQPGDMIGVSSWSTTLQAMLNAMRTGQANASHVVQMLGGVGKPSAEAHATHLTQRLAHLVGAQPVLLPAPGIVESKRARQAFLSESYVQEAIGLFPKLSIALVGVGTVDPSPLLVGSGNAFGEDARESLSAAGAVGDICLRFFDENGDSVSTPIRDSVIGISVQELKSVPRVVAVAGGEAKAEAIRAAVRSGWVDVLVTDEKVGRFLVGA